MAGFHHNDSALLTADFNGAGFDVGLTAEQDQEQGEGRKDQQIVYIHSDLAKRLN